MVRNVECPHCGNESVFRGYDGDVKKCPYCRRPVRIHTKRKKKKGLMELEPIEYHYDNFRGFGYE